MVLQVGLSGASPSGYTAIPSNCEIEYVKDQRPLDAERVVEQIHALPLIRKGSGKAKQSCIERARMLARELLADSVGDAPSCLQCSIIGLILFSTVAMILETVPDIGINHFVFLTIERIVTALFTLEIILRVWSAQDPCTYFISSQNIIDMIATSPFYIEELLQTDAVDIFHLSQHNTTVTQGVPKNVSNSFWTLRMVRVIQMIRLMRVLRVAKAARHFEVITAVVEGVINSINGLCALVAFVFMGSIISATVLFFLESGEEETDFVSVPASLWWAVSTVTAVGYGDMVPKTAGGKIAAGVTMVAGVLIISISVAIITTSFIEQYKKNENRVLRLKRIAALEVRRQSDSNLRRCGSDSDLLASSHRSLSPSSNRLVSRAPLSLSQDRNFLRSLTHLEDSVNHTLSRLEDVARRIAEGAPGGQKSRGKALDRHLNVLVQSVEGLQGQSSAWFKAASSLAEHIVLSEIEFEAEQVEDLVAAEPMI